VWDQFYSDVFYMFTDAHHDSRRPVTNAVQRCRARQCDLLLLLHSTTPDRWKSKTSHDKPIAGRSNSYGFVVQKMVLPPPQPKNAWVVD
jgi:hypothetical protein